MHNYNCELCMHASIYTAQGLLLNVDIVSQFDPAVIQELAALVEDCEACTVRINERTEQAHTCLNTEQSLTDEA